MVQILKQKKRQKILLAMLAVIVIITAFIWYSNYEKGPSKQKPAPFEEQALVGFLAIEEKLKEIELDFNILKDSMLKVLKFHGALPVTSGETGRENPFEPY